MTSKRILNTSAARRQHLLVEFSGLKTSCPQGVFMSLTPGDPTLWSGVIFVRKGPYARAILRFQISFPPAYPSLPPLVTFSTDIFHPLLTPLTTQTYTTDIQDSGTVSATDEERLPPGGFSLRHGFPGWFGRASRSAASSRQTSGQHAPPSTTSPSTTSGGATPDSRTSMSPTPGVPIIRKQEPITTYEVLKYIRSAFDDEDVLDSIPLEAAGNPGAWHAWRTHRLKTGKLVPPPVPPKDESSAWHDGLSDEEKEKAVGSKGRGISSSGSSSTPARKPGEWNWEGVWEVRVKRGIDGSLADPVLYGNAVAGDDLIRFLPADEDQLETMKENMIRSMEQIS